MPNIPADLAAHVGQAKHGGVTVLDVDRLTETDRNSLPAWWIEAAARSGPESAERAFAAWGSAVPGLFDQFESRLLASGASVFIGRNASGPLLVYAVASAETDAPYHCWYGSPPKEFTSHPTIDIEQLPAALVGFHSRLHDTFSYGLAVHNGMVAASELTLVGQHFDAEELEYFDTDQTADPDRLVAFYAGPGKQYLCAELSEETDLRAGWSWVEESLSPVVDIWQQIDSWLAERLI